MCKCAIYIENIKNIENIEKKSDIFDIFRPCLLGSGAKPQLRVLFYAITRYLEPSGEHISVMLLNRSRCFAIKLYLG